LGISTIGYPIFIVKTLFNKISFLTHFVKMATRQVNIHLGWREKLVLLQSSQRAHVSLIDCWYPKDF